MKTENLPLRHDYSDHELAVLSREISRALNTQSTLEREFESVRSDFKARITGQQALISSLSTRISGGFEMQNAECLVLNERESGHGLVVRCDNGHIVKRRNLESWERQEGLPLEPPPENAVTVELINDDETWPVESAQVGLFPDEFDALKDLPDVRKVIVVDSIEDPAHGPDYVKPQDETEPVKRPLPKGKKRT